MRRAGRGLRVEQACSDDVSSPVLGGPGENVGPALLYPWLWNSDLGRGRGGASLYRTLGVMAGVGVPR